MKSAKIHYILEKTGKMVGIKMVDHVPCVGDEVRFGEEGKEKFYTVTMRVFAYEEGTDHLFDRVNIGLKEQP